MTFTDSFSNDIFPLKILFGSNRSNLIILMLHVYMLDYFYEYIIMIYQFLVVCTLNEYK